MTLNNFLYYKKFDMPAQEGVSSQRWKAMNAWYRNRMELQDWIEEEYYLGGFLDGMGSKAWL